MVFVILQSALKSVKIILTDKLELTEASIMEINEYQELAMVTLNPKLSKRDVLINSVMGLCGESGEAIDIVKNGWHRGMNWIKSV